MPRQASTARLTLSAARVARTDCERCAAIARSSDSEVPSLSNSSSSAARMSESVAIQRRAKAARMAAKSVAAARA